MCAAGSEVAVLGTQHVSDPFSSSHRAVFHSPVDHLFRRWLAGGWLGSERLAGDARWALQSSVPEEVVAGPTLSWLLPKGSLGCVEGIWDGGTWRWLCGKCYSCGARRAGTQNMKKIVEKLKEFLGWRGSQTFFV